MALADWRCVFTRKIVADSAGAVYAAAHAALSRAVCDYPERYSPGASGEPDARFVAAPPGTVMQHTRADFCELFELSARQAANTVWRQMFHFSEHLHAVRTIVCPRVAHVFIESEKHRVCESARRAIDFTVFLWPWSEAQARDADLLLARTFRRVCGLAKHTSRGWLIDRKH
jgi:hypothetical protein